MEVLRYGDRDAGNVLIQMVDEHDQGLMEEEVRAIGREVDFTLLAVKVDDWNTDLSPWPAPPVFSSVPFGGGAGRTLDYVLSMIDDTSSKVFIGGYSLAALFALWGATQTDVFSAVAAASPSLWFPSFNDYLRTNELKTEAVYLSLGKREAKTRNRTMSSVAERTLECRDILREKGIDCLLEWNEGGHFQDTAFRTARAFSWLLSSYGVKGNSTAFGIEGGKE